MTNKQKEIQVYIVCGLFTFAYIIDSIHPMLSNTYTHQKEFESGQPWLISKTGQINH